MQNLEAIETDDLADLCKAANALYRKGDPQITDAEYDAMVAELTKRDPEHPWLVNVEPEDFEGKTIRLPERMLSTQKAYSLKEIKVWYAKVQEAARELCISKVVIKVMPKLDGYACYNAGAFQVTRGNGYQGTDISHAFTRGLSHTASLGKGEVVVNKKYFDTNLAGMYENSRNIVAAVIKEGALDPAIELAMMSGGVSFVAFEDLVGLKFEALEEVLSEELLDDLWSGLGDACHYDTDGLVFEVINPNIQDLLGNTNHHYRWQIAYKRNLEFHEVPVLLNNWQTSKTGTITPVVHIEPTRIGGVVVSKVTGHNAGNVLDKGIDTGAIVRVCRAGQVIPYIDGVVKPVTKVRLPKVCPSCDAPTDLVGDRLSCSNTQDCPAQLEATLEFFFKTLGSCDGFGPSITGKLVQAYSNVSLVDIFKATDPQKFFECAGISPGVAKNLVAELERAKRTPVEDWRFLAAFSLQNIGKGGCERILKQYSLNEVFELSAADICALDNFGAQKAVSMVTSLRRVRAHFFEMVGLFNILPSRGVATQESLITGKTVVFTGTMTQGNRADMEAKAKSLGAKVGSSVTSKTDLLVIGEGVGANKTAAAEKFGTKVLTEAKYLILLDK